MFNLRQPITKKRKAVLTILSFLLPLVLWSVVSYVPFLWHPYVKITDPGDTTVSGDYDYVAEGMMVDKDTVAKRNAELAAVNAKLLEGTPENPIYLPAPHEVFKAFYTAFKTPPARRGEFWLHESLLQSCKIIFWGFTLAAILGIPLGILCGTFVNVSALCEPFIDFVRYMPAPVFGALAVSIVGLNDEPKIAIIFIGTFFQMVLVIATTTSRLDKSLLDAGQTLGASNRQLVTRIIIPGILPNLYRDVRILIGWAWTYLVVAELIGAKSGISAFMYQAQRYKQFDNVYASIIMIGIIGLATDQLLAFIGRYMFPWESGKKPYITNSIRGSLRIAARFRDKLAEQPAR